jgi:hypothetical protein
VKNLFWMCAVFLLPVVLYFLAKRRSHNPEVTLHDICYRMLPVDRDLLLQIDTEARRPQDQISRELEVAFERLQSLGVKVNKLGRKIHMYSDRRELRNDLDDVKDQFQRISTNAGMVGDCASQYRLIQEKHGWEEELEASQEETQAAQEEARITAQAIQRVLDAERDLQPALRRVRLIIWLWDMSGFHKHSWGPVPDISKLHIHRVLEAYERVKLAAVNLARSYGEAVIAEDLAEAM